MSDKNKHRKKIITDFFRYRRKELTGKERNSFERELQRDSFAEEAADGFASIPPEESLKDILDLQKRIKVRTSNRKSFIAYRIAASIAVLMVISTIFLLVEKNNTGNRLADSSVQKETLEITMNQPITAIDRVPETRKVLPDRKTDISGAAKMIEPGKGVSASEKIMIADKQKDDSIAENKGEQVKVFVAEESLTPAARALSKEMVKAEAEAAAEAEAEVEVEVKKEDASTGFIPPLPVNGKSEFDKYIRDNLHLPDSTITGQRVVVIVSFLVMTDGRIDRIRIVRSPGKLFSDEAVRVIKSGPSWKPAEENGKKIEKEVRVRIVFR